ncbi:MAG: hypothetical protein ACHQ0J_11865 [Candidatus Dormibacterales bacterium]
MTQRTLGILAAALLVLGVGLGAGTLAFAVGSQDVVTGLPGPDGQSGGQTISNPRPFGPGMRHLPPGFGQPGGPNFGPRQPGQPAPWNQPEPSLPAPQQ